MIGVSSSCLDSESRDSDSRARGGEERRAGGPDNKFQNGISVMFGLCCYHLSAYRELQFAGASGERTGRDSEE